MIEKFQRRVCDTEAEFKDVSHLATFSARSPTAASQILATYGWNTQGMPTPPDAFEGTSDASGTSDRVKPELLLELNCWVISKTEGTRTKRMPPCGR